MEKKRYVYLIEVNQLYDNEKDDLYAWNINNNKIINLLNQQDARIKELEEQNGYIIFADGYDDNGNKVSKQVYTTYKSKCDELIKENKQLTNQYDLLNKKYCEEMDKNIALKEQLEEKNKEIKKLSLYSEKLYKLEARIGLEERTVGDVVEELDRLRNQLELSQKENMQLKQSQNQKAVEVLSNLKSTLVNHISPILLNYNEYVGKVFETIDNQIKELRV